MVTNGLNNASNTLSISEFTTEEENGGGGGSEGGGGNGEDNKTPIYRLYNTRTEVYLYTRGKSDRDKILAKRSDFEFTDGGPAFYARLNN